MRENMFKSIEEHLRAEYTVMVTMIMRTTQGMQLIPEKCRGNSTPASVGQDLSVPGWEVWLQPLSHILHPCPAVPLGLGESGGRGIT